MSNFSESFHKLDK